MLQIYFFPIFILFNLSFYYYFVKAIKIYFLFFVKMQKKNYRSFDGTKREHKDFHDRLELLGILQFRVFGEHLSQIDSILRVN